VAYPGEYLTMSSGFIHYYPELKRGDPKPTVLGTEWDWTAIWKISRVDFGRGETFYQFLNHATDAYLTYNATRYEFVRGTGNSEYVANLWDMSTTLGQDGSKTTIKHSQHPNGFLHAYTEKKRETRAVGILVHEPSKDIYRWTVVCDVGKKPKTQG